MNIFQAKLALANAAANNIATSQSPGSGAITLNGTVGTGNLDTARRVLITSGSDDSGITFTVIGKNRSGSALSETITGGNAVAVGTTQDFLSVSSVTHTGAIAGTVTVGTSGVASSPWFMLNNALTPMDIGIAVVVSGTINYSVEYTYDDPNAPFTGTFPTVFAGITALAAKAANADGSLLAPVFAVRLTQNSFSSGGTASMVVIQAGLG